MLKREVIWEKKKKRGKKSALWFPNAEILHGFLLFSYNILYKHAPKEDYKHENKGSSDDSFLLTSGQSTLTRNDITISQGYLPKFGNF